MEKGQLRAGVVLSYVTKILNSVVELAYTPVMLRLLGQSEYGLYTLVSSVVSYLGLMTFGISGAYLRFYTRAKAEEGEDGAARVNGMFFFVYLIIGFVALCAGMLLSSHAGLVFGKKLTPPELERAGVLLRIMSVNLAISIPASVFSSYVTAHEKYIFLRVLALAKCVLSPFLTLPLLLMGWGSLSLVCISLMATLFVSACEAYFAVKRLHMRVTVRNLKWRQLKEVYIFSLFVFLNQMVDQINWGIDSFLLGRFWGTTEVAIYGLASRVNSIYLGSSTAISSVFAPYVNRIVAENAENKQKLLTNLMIRVGRIQALILYLLLMGLVLLGQPFLIWMGGDVIYRRSYPVMLLLVFPVTVDLIQNLGIEIQRAENKHKFRALSFICLAVLNLAISIPLNMRYGAIGAAAGTAIALTLGNGLLMNWHYHFKLHLNMKDFWTSILKLAKGLILPGLYCAGCAQFIDTTTYLGFFATGAGLVAVYGLSMWRWGMNREEKKMVMNMIAGCVRKARI